MFASNTWRRVVIGALCLACPSLLTYTCDTWVALSDATGEEFVLLAKNSDRPVFDSQPLVLHASQTWARDAEISLGRVSIPQVEETHATLGSHPYWCWGYEEGINEHGVAIGNEGIWTKALMEQLVAYRDGENPKYGLTGMDLVRLGLERGRTAREALDVMTSLIEEYGQFGSGLPTADPLAGGYDNSFIIADSQEAWVLESTGTEWVAKRIEAGSVSISNTLSIRTDWDLSSPDLASFARARGWWPQDAEGVLDFLVAYGDESPIGQSKRTLALPRAETTKRLMDERAGTITTAWMMEIARDRSSSPAVDNDGTASSCVAVLPQTEGQFPVFWWAPARPSVSCYVPFFVHAEELPAIVSEAGTYSEGVNPPSQVEADAFSEGSYWWIFRDLAGLATGGVADRTAEVRAVFDPLEAAFAGEVSHVLSEAAMLWTDGKDKEARQQLAQFSAECVEQAVTAANTLRAQFASDTSTEIPETYRPYVGTYEATFADTTYSVLVKSGHLAVDVPGQRIYELRDPDENGRWGFVVSDAIAISFQSDESGEVVWMTIYQNGLVLELIREGITLPAEITPDQAQPYLGSYRNEEAGQLAQIIVQNGRLALDLEGSMIFELLPPDADGLHYARATDLLSVEFVQSSSGEITGLVLTRGGQPLALERLGENTVGNTEEASSCPPEGRGISPVFWLGLALVAAVLSLMLLGD